MWCGCCGLSSPTFAVGFFRLACAAQLACLEKWRVVGLALLGEYGFGLGVAVCLPGEHAEGVLFEPVVVESFAGEVVVDVSVGGFG